MTTDLVERVRSLYVDEGRTQYEVAALVGRSQSFVSDVVREHGITARLSNSYRHATTDQQVLDRILARCVQSPTGCWIWQGYLNTRGYGRIGYQRRVRATHRLTYEFMVAPIPDGLELDHLCRVKACCNPYHLEPVTRAVNLDRQRQAAMA